MRWTVADGQLPFSALVTIHIEGGQPSAISGIFSISKIENIPEFLVGMAEESVPMRQYSGVLFRREDFFDPSQFRLGHVLFVDPSESVYVDRATVFEMTAAFGAGALERVEAVPAEDQPGTAWAQAMVDAIDTLRVKAKIESELQEEIDFIDLIFGDVLGRHGFALAHANQTMISYANGTFVLDFCFDVAHNRMSFGGVYVTVETTTGRYNLRDVVEHLHPDEPYSSVHAKIKSRGLIEQRVVNEILDTYLDSTLRANDTSWEPSLTRELERKYPW